MNNRINNKVNKVDRELQAFLYQQLQKLEPFVMVDGQLIFEQVAKAAPEPEPAEMRLHYNTAEFSLEAEGKGDTVYEASSNATEKMIEILSAINDEMVDADERENAINQLQQHPYLH